MPQQFWHALDLGLAITVFYSFFCSERQHLATITDAFYIYIGIDHCLSDIGSTSLRFGCCAHKRAHIALVLVGLHLAGLVHHRCGAYRRAAAHVDGIARYGNQGTCRRSIVVNECPYRDFRLQKRGPDFVGIVERAAKRVDSHDDDVGFLFAGFLQGFFHSHSGRRRYFLVDGELIYNCFVLRIRYKRSYCGKNQE